MKVKIPENYPHDVHDFTKGKVYQVYRALEADPTFLSSELDRKPTGCTLLQDDDGDLRPVFLPGSSHIGNQAWEIVE